MRSAVRLRCRERRPFLASPGRVRRAARDGSAALPARTVVRMAPATTPPPLPGSMTVPPLFGWENILVILILLIAVAVAYFVASAVGTGDGGRSEWQAGLDARSARSRARLDLAADPPERRTEQRGPGSGP